MKKIIALALMLVMVMSVSAKKKVEKTDREVWVDIMYQMAEPVLRNMANGTLQQEMDTVNGGLELSPTWDNRDKKVSYMEAFGRLMAGLAPWLSLPDDDTAEGQKRKQLREWALKAYANAVDPKALTTSDGPMVDRRWSMLHIWSRASIVDLMPSGNL